MSRLETGVNLFGMMNCGKTTVGELVAARHSLPFVDTDMLIAEEYGQAPGDIIKSEGPDRFMIVQNEILRARPRTEPEIWATGGAVAKDPELVMHLGKSGIGVFLFVNPDILEDRTPEEDRLKLANPNGLSYRDLYLVERMPFYEAAADVTVRVDEPDENKEETAQRVIDAVLSAQLNRSADRRMRARTILYIDDLEKKLFADHNYAPDPIDLIEAGVVEEVDPFLDLVAESYTAAELLSLRDEETPEES